MEKRQDKSRVQNAYEHSETMCSLRALSPSLRVVI